VNRRELIAGILLVGAGSSPAAARAAAESPRLQVYKSPTCGCCGKWADHMREAGFDVEENSVEDVVSYKRKYGVPAELFTCHTAVVEGYVVEGHVPAEDVWRMLRERPAIKGIGVPGMPIGSPGMEGPDPDDYRTFAFTADSSYVFAVHRF
jgi:hypothetical protein